MTDARTVLEHDGHVLEIITEMIEVTPMSEPDPRWTYTDDAGHVHMAAETDDGRVWYSTLETYSEDHECDLTCGEDGCPSYLGCRICGERISPRQRAGRTRWIKGMTAYLIDGCHVDEAAARALAAAWQRDLNDRQGG